VFEPDIYVYKNSIFPKMLNTFLSTLKLNYYFICQTEHEHPPFLMHILFLMMLF